LRPELIFPPRPANRMKLKLAVSGMLTMLTEVNAGGLTYLAFLLNFVWVWILPRH
jgi:hypothetical protein